LNIIFIRDSLTGRMNVYDELEKNVGGSGRGLF